MAEENRYFNHDKDGNINDENFKRLDYPTYHYNCHSYTWYMQSTSNKYWMDDPSLYITDKSYVESNGNAGDIVAYFDSEGNKILHSAVINFSENTNKNSKSSISQLIVDSKWGCGSLIRAKGNQNPYYYTSIKYYTLNTNHTHDYTYKYKWISYEKHEAYCNCGDYITQGHVVSSGVSLNTDYYTCTLCGGSAKIGFIINNLTNEIMLCNEIIDDELKYYIEDEKIYFNELSYYGGIIFLSNKGTANYETI